MQSCKMGHLMSFSMLLIAFCVMNTAWFAASCDTNRFAISMTPAKAEVHKKIELECRHFSQDNEVISISWYAEDKKKKKLPSEININGNVATAIYSNEKVKRQDEIKTYTCQVDFRNGSSCAKSYSIGLVIYQPPGPLICDVNITSSYNTNSKPVILLCKIEDAGEPWVYGQIYRLDNEGNKIPEQQPPFDGGGYRGRSWRTKITLDEFIHNTYICATSEDGYWKNRHEPLQCIFPFSNNQNVIGNCTSKLDMYQGEINSNKEQLSECQSKQNSTIEHLSVCKSDINSFKQQLSVCQSNITSAKDHLSYCQSYINVSKEQLSDCQSEISSTKDHLIDCQRDSNFGKDQLLQFQKQDYANQITIDNFIIFFKVVAFGVFCLVSVSAGIALLGACVKLLEVVKYLSIFCFNNLKQLCGYKTGKSDEDAIKNTRLDDDEADGTQGLQN